MKIVYFTCETCGKEISRNFANFRQSKRHFCVDFVLPEHNIIIECDGNYWHSSLCAKNRDKIKDKLLTSLGYQVCRFGEDSIKSNSLECIKGVI